MSGIPFVILCLSSRYVLPRGDWSWELKFACLVTSHGSLKRALIANLDELEPLRIMRCGEFLPHLYPASGLGHFFASDILREKLEGVRNVRFKRVEFEKLYKLGDEWEKVPDYRWDFDEFTLRYLRGLPEVELGGQNQPRHWELLVPFARRDVPCFHGMGPRVIGHRTKHIEQFTTIRDRMSRSVVDEFPLLQFSFGTFTLRHDLFQKVEKDLDRTYTKAIDPYTLKDFW